jgi:hypothetical protein
VLVAAGLFAPLFIHHFFMLAWSLGMQLRLVGTAAIYDKLLQLRLGALADVTTGDSPRTGSFFNQIDFYVLC